MKTIHIKERVGKKFNCKNSNDTLNVVSVDFKDQRYSCMQTYDGQYGGKDYFYLDIPFSEFENLVVVK